MRKNEIEAPIVIIGTGLAGYSVAREFRKLDRETPLVLLSQDDGVWYSKPMLSNALAAGKAPSLLGNASSEKMAADLSACILCHTPVRRIDPDRQCIEAGDQSIPYAALVLAVGAQPVPPALKGNAAGEVLTVNDLGQYAYFRERLQHSRRVLIIGAGFVGCEFANDLCLAGHEVTLIDIAAAPLLRFLPAEAGHMIRGKLSDAGVAWYGGLSIVAVNRDSGCYIASLNDGRELEADLVLSAIGLRPRLELARHAGIAVNRGILTDTALETSTAGIYALGDCAETDGLLQPFVAPIMSAAKALAQTLHGNRTAVAYPPLAVSLKTPAIPVTIAAPRGEVAASWRIEHQGEGMRCLLEDTDARLHGFALLGTATADRMKLVARMQAESQRHAAA
jgi:rubredoxin-NAD+ reductase